MASIHHEQIRGFLVTDMESGRHNSLSPTGESPEGSVQTGLAGILSSGFKRALLRQAEKSDRTIFRVLRRWQKQTPAPPSGYNPFRAQQDRLCTDHFERRHPIHSRAWSTAAEHGVDSLNRHLPATQRAVFGGIRSSVLSLTGPSSATSGETKAIASCQYTWGLKILRDSEEPGFQVASTL